MCASAILVSAQVSMGSWKIYTPFNGIDQIIDTPDKVYYTSVGYLFSYDPESEETYAYTVQNRLSDSDIHLVRYNPEKKYLFIAYTNGNIDLLFDDGKVVNMSDIRDASLASTKLINDVYFSDGRIYAAADFGIVIFNDKDYVVTESGIFNKKVDSFIRLGNSYLISSEKQLYSISADSRINAFSRFRPVTNSSNNDAIRQLIPLDGDRFAFATDWQRRICTFSPEENSMEVTALCPDVRSDNTFTTCKDGYFFNAGTYLITLAGNSTGFATADLPQALQNKALGYWKSPSEIWEGSLDGLSLYRVDSSAATLVSGPSAPGSISVPMINVTRVASDGTLYITRTGNTRYNTPSSTSVFTPINRIRGNEITDICPDNITFDSAGDSPAGARPKNNQQITIDPWNPDRIYVGNWKEGFMVFEGNDHVMTLNGTNSPIADRHNGGTANAVTHEIAFDAQGNLWALQGYRQDSHHLMVLLPAAIAKTGEEPKVSDWYQIKIPKSVTTVDVDGRLFAAKKSGIVMVTSSYWESPVLFYDYNGTADTADDRYTAYSTFVDQDGRDFTAHYNTCFAEDLDGKVWLGTDDGVIEFPNPKTLLTSNVMRRPKVNRNDGTNTADFLLSGIKVLNIAVDHANRKWIATQENGVYLVSPDGTEILEHYTTDNSPLPSNHVGDVAVSPTDNKVYFGTNLGLAEYNSSSSPAAENYSEVIAYPNPVRPEFTGWITVRGLMDNSYVKITDAAGNLVYATLSNGGMITWNGCNAAGHKVPTGVYYVFASQKEGGSSAAVTKIMIVR